MRRARVGELSRTPAKWKSQYRTPNAPFNGFGPRFYAVYESDAGRVDGAVIYRAKLEWTNGVPDGTLQVSELIARTPEAYAALWRYCLDVDLVARVRGLHRPVDEPLRWMLADSRRLRVTHLADNLWVRLLDIPAALSARRYAAPERLTFEVSDAFLPDLAGRYTLEGAPDGAACARSDTRRSLAGCRRARRGLSGRRELLDACAGRTDTRGEPWRARPRRRDVRHIPCAVLQHALLGCCNSMPFSRVVLSGQVALGKNSLRRSCFLALEYLFGYHTGYPPQDSLSGRNTLVSVETLPVTKSEFTVAGERIYDRRSPVRWIVSHVLRYKRWLATFLLGTLLTTVVVSAVPALTGAAFNEVLKPNGSAEQLFLIFLAILGLVVAQAILDPLGVAGSEFIAQRIERDARDELYLNLLGKSQTFHNRQQVGDIMARATNDVRQLNAMMTPGVEPDARLAARPGRSRSLHRAAQPGALARAAALHGCLRVRCLSLHQAAQPGRGAMRYSSA